MIGKEVTLRDIVLELTEPQPVDLHCEEELPEQDTEVEPERTAYKIILCCGGGCGTPGERLRRNWWMNVRRDWTYCVFDISFLAQSELIVVVLYNVPLEKFRFHDYPLQAHRYVWLKIHSQAALF